ncbi:arginine--tRNA ligase [Candidatus Beckwithbacteria bacterium]|nr:arginine--tRNA ligase [Candidatus Beckwithbacteria bacterium]
MTDETFSLDQLIINALRQAIQDLGLEAKITVEHPKDDKHGDYASNVALTIFPKLKIQNTQLEVTNPRTLAETIKTKLLEQENIKQWCQKIEVAGPGFLNFYLDNRILAEEIKKIISLGNCYGHNQTLKGKKVLCEFTDPNPFKEFHIGHLYSNAVGESLSRIFEAQGAEVKRANYFGDVGMHVAKAIWGIQQKLNKERLSLEDLETKDVAQRAKFLGQAYALGAKAYEEDEVAAQAIKKLNKLIYDQDQSIIKLYQKGKAWSLAYFETIYKRVGTKFDYYLPESEVGPLGLDYVKKQLAKGVFEESDGAIVFPGKKYGLHTRVFVNNQGLPTYEAKDLGLAPVKYQKFPYDRSIIITANEINEYFKVILKVLSMIEPELAQRTTHLGHGMVKLPEGKMSSRTGNVVTGSWLLDEVKAAAVKQMQEGELKYSQTELDTISEMIAVGAIKYAFLKSNIGGDVIFDIGSSLSLQGNSGPYIQYTHARCWSILEKAGQIETQNVLKDYQANDLENSILRYLYRFPEVVLETAAQFAPHLICTYLYELAQRYNSFYNKYRILQAETEEEKNFRLILTQAVNQILHNGLYLLGIQAPERM